MRYIMEKDVAIRSWQFVPAAYIRREEVLAKKLSLEQFFTLLACDGKRDLEKSEVLQGLIDSGLVREADEKDALTPWQEHRKYDNRYFPRMNLMLTERCNYNCRHCFNAADNTASCGQWSQDDIEKLLDEAAECGIRAFTITGGEPMLHPHFMEILKGIYARDMFVEELNTNGFFLTQKTVDEMLSFGCRPLVKISFDGIGHHDWMRGMEGAEEDTLRAIRLCVENDLAVMVQMNVHRGNLDTIGQTLEMMDAMGVAATRIIRTSESPRWRLNGGGLTLSPEEYFEEMMKAAEAYAQGDHRMNLVIWQFLRLMPAVKAFGIVPVVCPEGSYRDSIPVCRGNRGMPAVTANGELVPCMQMSGYYALHGKSLGNVKKDGLTLLLRGGRYVDTVCSNLKDLKEHNTKCGACRWFKYCCGGCRALGLAMTENPYGSDLTKCAFFEQGWYDRITAAFPGWMNLTPMNGKEEALKDPIETIREEVSAG